MAGDVSPVAMFLGGVHCSMTGWADEQDVDYYGNHGNLGNYQNFNSFQQYHLYW